VINHALLGGDSWAVADWALLGPKDRLLLGQARNARQAGGQIAYKAEARHVISRVTPACLADANPTESRHSVAGFPRRRHMHLVACTLAKSILTKALVR
jgi:hypothetical protein